MSPEPLRVLWLTNDLPPRAGGIEQFVGSLLARVHPTTTVVVGPAPGDPAEAATHDASQHYRTVRAPGRVLPTRGVRRLVAEVAASHRPEVVVLGAAWPLGELAGDLRRDLDVPVVALSHGLEAGMAGAGLGAAIRRATRDLATLTTISDFTAARLAPHVRARRTVRVPPGVDVARFHPAVDGARCRQAWGVPDDALVVGCLSRLVARKGQDRLVAAWPEVQRRHPDAWLVLVGEGPLAARLDRRIAALGPQARIRRVGRAAWEDLPAAYAALDLFAMPCRTRLGGLDVEGLGIVYLEAQAVGVPVVAGRSGGAPETVAGPDTGTVVDGDDPPALVAALDRWLGDPAARRAAAAPGRQWAVTRWSWDAIAADLTEVLAEAVAAG